MTDLRLLGPLEAMEDGEPLALPVGKPRALLARLLIDAGRVVAVETLIDGLWGEHPPASANKLIQVYVSQLRKVLGHAAIETRRPGYLVGVEHSRLDLVRFEALTEAARVTADAARRAELLGEALSLWRGAALAEFRKEPFARPAARRLTELRLAALEQRIDAELELGRHDQLVGELEQLVAEEPLRERPRRQLMLALYRSGRQAEALARYREGRQLLVQELGMDPTPALQELERAILRRDPGLDERRGSQSRARGRVICAGADLHELVAPLCGEDRELLVVELATDAAELGALSRRLEQLRERLAARGVEARTACFTSTTPGEDLVRLAVEQEADLLVTGPLSPHAHEALTSAAPCDVGIASRGLRFQPDRPVVVPFGGGREEWAALELGAWIARAHGLPLRLLGPEASAARRDASRMLAAASLALQRFAGIAAEPVIVPAGVEGIRTEPASLVVVALPVGDLDPVGRALVESAALPVLLVRGGLRPGGLAPDQTLTRFSWSLGDPP